MNLNVFEQPYQLQTGDRLIRKKGLFSRHHGIYVYTMNGPMIAENQAGIGVQYVSLETFLQGINIEQIELQKFAGTEQARQAIITRINALLGTPYNLINFNCEHFAELIQNENPISKQVGVAAIGAIVIGIGWLIFGGKGRR